MKNNGQSNEKQILGQVFDKEIDRRAFLQKTTKLAGAAFGLSLFNPLGSIPVLAASDDSNILSQKKPGFQFGLVADAQYADVDTPSGSTRYYRASLGKLAEAVKTFNENDVTFTIHLGDIIDRDASSFSKILPIYNRVKGPKYHLLGNHDYAMDAKKVADVLGMPNFYYDFSYNGWRFVVLDTNDLSLYANSVGSEKYQHAKTVLDVLSWSGADNAQSWNGGVDSVQMVWLQDVLSKSVKAGEKVVVIGHHPIAPLNMHNAWNYEALVKVLESSGNVVAYFNGHNHAGNYAEKKGIYYVNFKGMVETADTNAYSIVRVYPNRLEIKGYGREPNRVLSFGKMSNTENIKEIQHA
ncbi:metallophosphoesterase [Paenibacillus solisilvae]|uniref:Metallophosphoesterase n=1 Tax=Paenibacillus solisilvae TaxID=2486751 RepID=A0ABW0VYU0_9BACL